jgi:opacity protein-like surface antigen
MRKVVFLVIVGLAFSAVCLAADFPKAEIFGGYSYFRADTTLTGMPSQNSNGWEASVTGNLNRFLGVTADFNGDYTSASVAGANVTGHIHNFLFGPTVSYRTRRVTPFVHALFGDSHLTGSTVLAGTTTASSSNDAFAMALGGGADVKLSRLLAVRLAQIDYLRTQFSSTSQNNMRYSAGLVLRF